MQAKPPSPFLVIYIQTMLLKAGIMGPRNVDLGSRYFRSFPMKLNGRALDRHPHFSATLRRSLTSDIYQSGTELHTLEYLSDCGALQVSYLDIC